MLKHWPIVLIFIWGFWLRSLYLPQGQFLFSYDQARDAYTVSDLLRGDLKIQGPPTSTRDFFHGVLYYYAIAPGYWLGRGSPIVAAHWWAFLNSGGILLLYWLGQSLFSRRFPAALLALMYAASYEASQYSFYLANTSLAVLTVPWLYYHLWQWSRGSSSAPWWSGLALGLTFQANFLLIYHAAVIAVAGLLRLIPLTRRNIISSFLGFGLASASMWLSEIKFGLPSLDGPASLLSRSTYSALHITPQAILDTALTQLTRVIGLNLFPQAVQIVTVVFILLVVVFSLFRRPQWWWIFLLALVGFMPALVLGGISSPYIHAGLGSLVLVITVYFAARLAPVLLIIPLLANLSHIITVNSTGKTEFAIQTTMTLKNELAAIDYIYAQSEGQPFSFSSITAPLNINTTWSYLFNWYGRNTYGYLPSWHGPDQAGQVGDNLSRPGPTHRYFLIIEPSQGLPEDLIDSQVVAENKLSNFNHLSRFGEIIVHNRTRKP